MTAAEAGAALAPSGINSDALGHLVDVWEPDASTGSLVNETAYTYDPLNNLLTVTQKGNASSSQWRTRSFTYDSLSRLLTATNPESGQITWTYDNDSNVLTKKDARNVTITYNYDQLHRVATVGSTPAKIYSNGDHQVDYFFDQTSYNGLAIAESVNQRTGMSDATGQTAWTFDSEGRTKTERRTINISGVTTAAITNSLNYTYNLDSSLASITYPSGHVVNYSYNTAGRTTSVIDPNGGTAINYLTWDCPKTGTYCYSPHGEELRLIRGATSTFAGTITDNAFNSRLQPSQFIATPTGSASVLSLNFNFNQGVNDNGTLARIVNNLTNNPNKGLSKTFTYDQLNRIVSAVNDSTAADTSNWGNIYVLDAWGNLYQKNPCNGIICPTKTYSDSLTVSVSNNKNQFDTYSYDNNGNLLNDQLGHTFTYDAENRPYGGGGVNYYYDGEGERVAKTGGTLYWFGTTSSPVVETGLNGSLNAEYIFANGQRIATRKSSGLVYYYFADQVGSAQAVTNSTGGVAQQIEYHPYGEERIITNNITQNYRFTGKEHDSETNDDYFGARYYGSAFGRFLTPDWAATPVPIPYAVIGNPQTLNLYSYVENNPITGTDPDGHAGDGNRSACQDPKGCDPKQTKADAQAELKAWMAQAKAEFAAAKAAVAKGEQVAAQAVDDLNSTVGLGNSHCAEGSVGDCANAVGMLGTAAVVEVVSDGAASEGSVGRNAGQLHHIATDKSIVGGFTKQFEKIFAKAGKNLQWGENLMQLEGHAGRHSELYHKWVLDKLTKATNGLVGEEAAKALTNTLREIRAEIQRNPRVLKGDGI